MRFARKERWRLAGWPGGVSPPIVQDSTHSPGNLSGETPPSQPARRQRSRRRQRRYFLFGMSFPKSRR